MENTDNSYPNVKEAIFLVMMWMFITFILGMVFSTINIYSDSLTDVICFVFTSLLTLYLIQKLHKRDVGVIKRFEFKGINYRLLPFVIFGAISCLLLGVYQPSIPILDRFSSELLGDYLMSTPTIFDFLKFVILVPIFEELFFRGIILGSFLKKYSPREAIILSAIIFAIPHGAGLLGVLLGGLFLGWIYFMTNNLLLSIVAHASVNLLGFAMRLALIDEKIGMSVPKWGMSDNVFINISILFFLVIVLVICVKLICYYSSQKK